MSLLEINNLNVDFVTDDGRLRAVDGISLQVDTGETLAIVGESGSGKSVTSLALMGLIDEPGVVQAERIQFNEQDLLRIGQASMRNILGNDLSMIFQDPASSLNPCFTVARQLNETLKRHTSLGRRARRKRALQLLNDVGIPDPENRITAWPHQLSGGMSQRVMIALAIACSPSLLIADEPTTALDVTIQAQIMDLLASLSVQSGMAMILITHDLGVVADAADRVLVMYAGQAVELADKDALFSRPRHPYTRALMKSMPAGSRLTEGRRLPVIPGKVPRPGEEIHGCRFHPRCEFARSRCKSERPTLDALDGRSVRCFYPLGEIE
jgi:dipeptide transport system ATP-binding protein